MDMIGLDLHKRESHLCIGHDDGTVEERRIVTSRERFTALLGGRARARILLEASTESEWVARDLEQVGHEVIVADPNFAAMYAARSRRVKTDRRDARTLMEACRLGAYRPAYRLSDARRHVRAELAVREALVRTRTRYIALAKAFVRRDGLRVASSESHLVAQRIAALELSAMLAAELAPLFAVLAPLNAQIARPIDRIAAFEKTDPIGRAPRDGAERSGRSRRAAIVATIDDVTRFRSAHQFEAFLGARAERAELGRATPRRGTSPRRATRARGTSWSRRAGASSARTVAGDRRAARVGPQASPRAAANASPSSRWRVGSPGSSTRCGGTSRRTTRREASRAAAARRRVSYERAGRTVTEST